MQSAELLWLAIVWVVWYAELLWPRLNASCVQNKLSRVGVGVVGLYENKANSARPPGAGAGAWLSLAKLRIGLRKSVKNVWDYLPREFYLQFHLLIGIIISWYLVRLSFQFSKTNTKKIYTWFIVHILFEYSEMFKFTKVTIVYDDRPKKSFHSISLHFISYTHS